VIFRLLADEDFDNDILHGLVRRHPELDVVRVQDSNLAGEEDPVVLEWAAQNRGMVLTHDFNTMLDCAYTRVEAGLSMLGVIAIRQSVPVRRAIEEIEILVECSTEGEWEGQVIYLPLS
jgi:hypothetical protein